MPDRRDDNSFDPWWRRGLCAEIGSHLFFVGTGQSVAAAQQACRICPVRIQCLADALASEVEYGIFGGFAPHARHELAQSITPDAGPIEVARRAVYDERRRAHDRGTRATDPDRRHRLHT